MLAIAVEIEEHSRRKALHLVAVLKDSVLLGDVYDHKIVCVDFVVDDSIGHLCREHDSQRCVHVGYCMAIRRVY